VPEWRKTGHRLLAHSAVGRFVRCRLIDGVWGRGFVNIDLLGGLVG
jgi:hypothetical protein